MTASEVQAILGGPPGDYAGRVSVTYARGGVGADDSGYSKGTNWWGVRGVIQVHFDNECLAEDVGYYPACFDSRITCWDALRATLTLGTTSSRHRWVAADW